MIKVTVGVKTTDHTDELAKMLKGLSGVRVLVGIPEKEAGRPGSGVNNAQLVFLHTHGVRKLSMIREMMSALSKGSPYSLAHQLYLMAHGSPAWRIPPRPIIEPSIEANKEAIAKELKKAAMAYFNGDETTAMRYLHRAGITGANAARAWFTDVRNSWAPNAPETIKKKGFDRPLIDTGEMRKAITSVVKGTLLHISRKQRTEPTSKTPKPVEAAAAPEKAVGEGLEAAGEGVAKVGETLGKVAALPFEVL